MGVDVLLTTITLIVAVIGTLLKDPPRFVKVILIVLAILASAGSIVKAYNNESDKEFMKTALASNLTPSNSSFAKLTSDVDEIAKTKGFDLNRCHHTQDGMTCFLSTTSGDKRTTLVFNKSDIAEMYANQIARKPNKSMIEKLFKTRYSPNDLDEEFLDKIGVLAFGTFFNMYKHYPADYNYDDHFGVIITIDGNGKKLQISQIEIAQMKESAAPILFYELEQKLRSRYSDIIK